MWLWHSSAGKLGASAQSCCASVSSSAKGTYHESWLSRAGWATYQVRVTQRCLEARNAPGSCWLFARDIPGFGPFVGSQSLHVALSLGLRTVLNFLPPGLWDPLLPWPVWASCVVPVGGSGSSSFPIFPSIIPRSGLICWESWKQQTGRTQPGVDPSGSELAPAAALLSCSCRQVIPGQPAINVPRPALPTRQPLTKLICPEIEAVSSNLELYQQ